jgi:predicted XRE-type DNA-binding protein
MWFGKSTRHGHVNEDARAERLNLEIRAHMARHRMAQSDLGQVVGVSQGQASARLRGQMRWRITELWTLADHFGINLADLIASAEQGAQQAKASA